MSFIKVGDTIYGDSFTYKSGNSVAILKDGTVIATGAYLGSDSNGNNKGFVRLYKNNSGTWFQIGSDIYGENIDDRFGYNVSLSDDGSIIAIKSLKNISSFCFVNKIFDFRKGSPQTAEVFI